ncbi:MAG: hypothetical protein QXS47_00910 [Thermoplasmata archaeon]
MGIFLEHPGRGRGRELIVMIVELIDFNHLVVIEVKKWIVLFVNNLD